MILKTILTNLLILFLFLLLFTIFIAKFKKSSNILWVVDFSDLCLNVSCLLRTSYLESVLIVLQQCFDCRGFPPCFRRVLSPWNGKIIFRVSGQFGT